MQPEKLTQLEKQHNDQSIRLTTVENTLDNLRPVVSELKEVAKELHGLTVTIAKNTVSQDALKTSQDALQVEYEKAERKASLRYDKLEAKVHTITNEVAENRPLLTALKGFHNKIFYAGIFLITLAVAVIGYVVKAG